MTDYLWTIDVTDLFYWALNDFFNNFFNWGWDWYLTIFGDNLN